MTSLFYYRLRSAPLISLLALPAIWLVLSAALFESFRPAMEPTARTSAVFMLLHAGVIALGLCTAFLVSVDVDPPEELLRSVPTPYWHMALERVVSWLLVSLLSVEVYAYLGAGPSIYDAELLRAVGLPNLLFVSSLALLSATFAGSYFGGAGALVFIGFVTLAEVGSKRFPLRLRDLPASPTWPDSRWLLVVVAVAAFAIAGWRLRR